MRSNKSDKNKCDDKASTERIRWRVRRPFALTAIVAVIALAPVAGAAQRLNSSGASGGSSIMSVRPSGGPLGITGNAGGRPGITGNPTGKPGITVYPGGKPGIAGGTTIGGGRVPGGNNGGKDRPHKPGWKPPIIVAVPPLVTTVAPVTAGGVNPQPYNKGSGSPTGPRIAPGSSSGMPPAGERRYVPDEVLVQLASTVPEAAVDGLAQRLRLTRLESHTSNGITMFRWRIPDGRPVPEVIRSLQGLALSARPNYLYKLEQAAGEQPPSAGQVPQGDHWQYALAKLRLPQAHALAKGEKVLVAVIDSGIDGAHPELAGMVVDSFDALKSDEKAHAHGTGIAGAIVAHARLMGVAPEARILAVRAFSAKARTSEATTYSIVRGIDWAIARGARIINMSFTGPRDPSIEERLAQAGKRRIILIAAAGNAGPKAPEAYPAAYSNVIAVTATDADDKLFQGANRGRYIAVAAPGVDLLLPAPDAGYQFTTGTSFAAAEVSGIVALMLERKPGLGQDGVRKALIGSARDLGPRGIDTQFGAGLVDAYQAVRSLATTGARLIPTAMPQ